MAAITLLKRAVGKAHTTSIVEGTDDAVLDSIITSGVTTADLYNDANTTTINVGGSAQTTGNIMTGAAMTTLAIGTGMGSGDVIDIGGASSQLDINGSATITGDLTVNGSTTTVATTNLAISASNFATSSAA